MTKPTKTDYIVGEELDLTGGKILKIMASGQNTEEILLTDNTVQILGYNKNQEGTQTITVRYNDFEDTFVVRVSDDIASIKVGNTPKTEYKYGEKLDVTNGTIQVISKSGEVENVNITESMVTGYNPTKLGKQTLTVNYNGFTTSYIVEVKDYAIGIEISAPNKLIYNINEKLDLTGATVTLKMASGAKQTPTALTEAMVTGFDSSKVGAKEVSVNYNGFKATFTVTIEDPENGINLKSLPNKTTYLYGEELDLTGAVLEAVTVSGDTKTVNITKNMISGYNPYKVGNQVITVSYNGFTTEFGIVVNDYEKAIQITKPAKTSYEYGEELDLTAGKVTIIMARGKVSETVDMTATMLSKFDNTKVGNQNITVEYKGLKTSFVITVTNPVKGINLNTEPNKTNYKYGESLDITGATINVTRNSGTETISVQYNK